MSIGYKNSEAFSIDAKRLGGSLHPDTGIRLIFLCS
jgi:hypothetical protein